METKNLPVIIKKQIADQKININEVNLILPTATFGEIIGEYDKVTLEIVDVSSDKKEGDVFPIGKNFAFNARPLLRFANAVGIEWDIKSTTLIDRTDTVSRAKATGAYRKPNGEWIVLTEEKTVDLTVLEEEQTTKYEEEAEKGEPYWENNYLKHRAWPQGEQGQDKKRKWIEKQIKKAMLQYKKFRDERAMTGAKERVIRKLLALKSTYTEKELQKPFAFPRIILDTRKMLKDPIAQQAAIDKMTGAVGVVFGAGSARSRQEIEGVSYNVEERTEDEKPGNDKPPEVTEEDTPDKDEWDDEQEQPTLTPEEQEVRDGILYLRKILKLQYLSFKARTAITDLVESENPVLDAVNAMIERAENYLSRPNIVQNNGDFKENLKKLEASDG